MRRRESEMGPKDEADEEGAQKKKKVVDIRMNDPARHQAG